MPNLSIYRSLPPLEKEMFKFPLRLLIRMFRPESGWFGCAKGWGLLKLCCFGCVGCCVEYNWVLPKDIAFFFFLWKDTRCCVCLAMSSSPLSLLIWSILMYSWWLATCSGCCSWCFINCSNDLESFCGVTGELTPFDCPTLKLMWLNFYIDWEP